MRLGPDSQILLINTEGNTDPDHFRRVVWEGGVSVPQEYLFDVLPRLPTITDQTAAPHPPAQRLAAGITPVR